MSVAARSLRLLQRIGDRVELVRDLERETRMPIDPDDPQARGERRYGYAGYIREAYGVGAKRPDIALPKRSKSGSDWRRCSLTGNLEGNGASDEGSWPCRSVAMGDDHDWTISNTPSDVLRHRGRSSDSDRARFGAGRQQRTEAGNSGGLR